MITLRKAENRGRTKIEWLDSRHSFSFGHYRDPEHTGFRNLRVINEDRVAPGGGFGTHPHRDMEILSLVLNGAMRHQDSIGNGSLIRAGELQKMSAGTGITHSEFNASDSGPLHFYQIWIEPERRGLEPEYQQIDLNGNPEASGLQLIGGHDVPEDAVTIHQDVRLYLGTIKEGSKLHPEIAPHRHAWIQVMEGELELNATRMDRGDGAAVSEESGVELASPSGTSFLLFDLA